jgi:hypothetical protein
MIKRLENLKNTVNKYMADIRPERLTTCQSERKSILSRRPSILGNGVFDVVRAEVLKNMFGRGSQGS